MKYKIIIIHYIIHFNSLSRVFSVLNHLSPPVVQSGQSAHSMRSGRGTLGKRFVAGIPKEKQI